MSEKKFRICFVATVEFAVLAFLRPHMKRLASDFDITIIVNSANPSDLSNRLGGIRVISIPFARKPNPIFDLITFFRLITHLAGGRYDAVHSIMPKTGLLAMLAASVVRIPHRIHTFTGQIWVGYTGIRRFIFKSVDRIISALATRVLADSKSQRAYLISERIISENRIEVLANGSICGVDPVRFKPNPEQRALLRAKYKIESDSIVLLFLGRMNRDKGIRELTQAFQKLSAEYPQCWLVLVGPDEDGMREYVTQNFPQSLKRIIFEPYTASPENFMALSDIFCLPSYREGFGSVVIEAAAVGVPSVASRIYGLTDAIQDEATGLLCAPQDVHSLGEKISILVRDASLRQRLGHEARIRAVSLFSEEVVTQSMFDFYKTLSTGALTS